MLAHTLLGALLFCLPRLAHAHPTPGSVVFVDFTVDGARLEHDAPIEELERSMHLTLAKEGETPAAMVLRHQAQLLAYVAPHLRAASVSDGAAWRVEVLEVVGHASDDGPRARFRFALHAPAPSSGLSVALHDEIVTHEVISHYTMVYVRSDFAAGVGAHAQRLVGTIHTGHTQVVVTRKGSFWRGFGSVASLGIDHIATGTDHLMFLFALVLVAPVSATHRRWTTTKKTADTLRALVRVVSAFTVGHSVTLALGALGSLHGSSTLIEAAIALSILATAAHAIRPIFPRQEAWVALLFGLVHGLAFADTLVDSDLGHAQAVWTLLGFNTGIELAQLGLLLLVVPWLLLLARTRFYAAFRVGAGSVALVFASGWLLERTTGFENPIARPLAWLEAHPLELLVALAVGTLVCSRVQPAHPQPAGDGKPVGAVR